VWLGTVTVLVSDPVPETFCDQAGDAVTLATESVMDGCDAHAASAQLTIPSKAIRFPHMRVIVPGIARVGQ